MPGAWSLLIAAGAIVWTPPQIASDQFESHPAFDPLTGDLYFVRSAPDFSGWRILFSHCGRQGWTKPIDAPFAGDGVEADPVFTDKGKTLWFISTRATDGVKRKDLDIWRVSRDGRGRWGTPERLPAPVNSEAPEWFPRPSPDGWLYFGSGRPGGFGKTDIWRAHRTAKGWRAENAGPAINSAGDEYEPLISPDGKRMLVQAGTAYYESRMTAKGWSPRVKLGPEINVNGSEIGALFSPSGKSLMFARDVHGGKSGELMLMRGAGESWPKPCPEH